MGSFPPSLSPQRTEEAPRAPVRGFFFSVLGDAGASGGGTLSPQKEFKLECHEHANVKL